MLTFKYVIMKYIDLLSEFSNQVLHMNLHINPDLLYTIHHCNFNRHAIR